MDNYTAVDWLLYANGGQITDRAVLQKLAYFASKKVHIDNMAFKGHHYGPFSHNVVEALADSCNLGTIHENRIHENGCSTYEYSLAGDKLKEVKNATGNKDYNIVSKVVKICKKHTNLKTDPLACAAKTHYIVNKYEPESKDFSCEDIVERIEWQGWEITRMQVKEAQPLIADLRI